MSWLIEHVESNRKQALKFILSSAFYGQQYSRNNCASQIVQFIFLKKREVFVLKTTTISKCKYKIWIKVCCKNILKVLKHTQKQSKLQTTPFCSEILCGKMTQLFSEYALCFLPLLAQMNPGRGIFPHQYLLEYYMHFFHYNTRHCNSHRIYYIFRGWHVQCMGTGSLCVPPFMYFPVTK